MIDKKIITLELPHKSLSPNARPNRFAKSNLTKQARTTASRETYKCMNTWGLPSGTYYVVSLRFIAYWKTTRGKRDDVNLLASCKAYEDGVQDAIGQDDSTWSLEKPVHGFDPDNPRLEIEIEIEIL